MGCRRQNSLAARPPLELVALVFLAASVVVAAEEHPNHLADLIAARIAVEVHAARTPVAAAIAQA